MTGPKRTRAPEPDPSPAPAAAPRDEPRPVERPPVTEAAPPAADTSPAPAPAAPREPPRAVEPPPAPEAAPEAEPHEFVWPPPAAEIDALEVVHLTPPDEEATPHVWATPSRRDLTTGDLRRLAQLTRGETLERDRVGDRARRDRYVRVAGMVALIAISMTVGIFLGARHARRAMLAEQAVGTAPAASASTSTTAPAGATSARPPDTTPPTQTAQAPGASGPSSSASSSAPAPAAAANPSGAASRTPARGDAPRVAAAAADATLSAANANSPRTITSIAPAPVSALPTTIPPAASSPAPLATSTPSPPRFASQTGGAAQLAIRLPESQPIAGLDDTLQTLTPVSSPARRAEASGVVGRTADAVQISDTLARYAHAYTTLDAKAARAAWPSLDVEALSRAFSNLKSQTMTFDRCTVQSVEYDTATASCDGSTTVVRRVGHTRPIVEPLKWTFTLRRNGGEWVINTVRVRR